MHGDSRCADQQHDIIYRTSTGDGIEAIGCMTCEED